MAKNTGTGSRKGAVNNRDQAVNSSGSYVKRNATTQEVLAVKKTPGKFKGVAMSVDGRRKAA